MTIAGKLDQRFSEATGPVDWHTVSTALGGAELYWLTTVQSDGRPHVTPLVGIWVDTQDGPAIVFCTGPGEQKARNLDCGAAVAVTTGSNSWNSGLDVVVEGRAVRVTGRDRLTALAEAYRAKYGEDCSFEADYLVFDPAGNSALVFRVDPAKVIAFAKNPHGQTTFEIAQK